MILSSMKMKMKIRDKSGISVDEMHLVYAAKTVDILKDGMPFRDYSKNFCCCPC